MRKGSRLPVTDRCESGRQHRALHFSLRESSSLQFAARYMDDRANNRDQPRGGYVASEDAAGLASFDERNDLRKTRLARCIADTADQINPSGKA